MVLVHAATHFIIAQETSNPPSGCHLPDGSDHPSSHLAVVNREKRNGWDPLWWHTVVPQPICSSVLHVETNGGEAAFPRVHLRAQYTRSRACLLSIFHTGWTICSQPRFGLKSSNTLLLCVYLIDPSDWENHDHLLILIPFKKKMGS